MLLVRLCFEIVVLLLGLALQSSDISKSPVTAILDLLLLFSQGCCKANNIRHNLKSRSLTV